MTVPTVMHEIHDLIFELRGVKVMLDRDLAELYGVETKMLKRQVRRNSDRFPPDFMFELTKEELNYLRCQFGTSSTNWGGTRYLPMAFTENGIAMLSSVLSSQRAIEMNIRIMRIFTQMRTLALTHREILLKVEALERSSEEHDEQLTALFGYLRQLSEPPEADRKKLGFRRKDEQID